MALLACLASLSGIPTELQSHYREQVIKVNGQDVKTFVLDVQEANGLVLDNVQGLKNSLAAARTERDTFKDTVAAFGEITPTAAKAAVAKVAEFANLDPKKQAEEAVRIREAQLVEKHKTELDALTGTVGNLTGQLQDSLVISKAREALSSVSDAVDVLLPHVTPRIKMVENPRTKKFEAVVLDKNGNPGVADGAGNPMTFDHLVKEFQGNPQFKPLFRASGNSGAGGGGNSGAGSGDSGTGTRRVSVDGSGAIVGESLEDLASGKTEIVRN